MIVEKYTPDGFSRRTIVLRVEGLIKFGESAELFQAALSHVLRATSVVVVDLSKIDYIDSTGIGELVAVLIREAKANPDLIVSCPSERILKLIKVAGAINRIQIFLTEGEALTSVADGDASRGIDVPGPRASRPEHRSPAPPFQKPSPAPRASVPPTTERDSYDREAAKSGRRSLKIFVCHASNDKTRVRVICHELSARGVDVWFDEEKLLPGQNWRLEIQRALRSVDAVLVCLSATSVTKAGYVQKEIKAALDIADEQPEGTIFVIPAKLEPCNVPERLASYQWVDLGTVSGLTRLFRALSARAADVGAAALPDGTARPGDLTLV